MEIPQYQGRSPSGKQERGGKDRKSRVTGYERFLSGMEIPQYQVQSPSGKQGRGGKDRKSRVAGYERFLSGMEISQYQDESVTVPLYKPSVRISHCHKRMALLLLMNR